MKIKVVTVGKLKEKYLKDGIAEYSKRISRFAKFEMIELSDEKTPDKASESENQKILEIEGQRILSKIADRDFVIVLAIEGKTFFSEEFSKQLEETSIKGFSTLTFIIGGSLGLLEVGGVVVLDDIFQGGDVAKDIMEVRRGQ
ncbi:23S rRNA (pseudouridine(1915)-N(3))-methyltransferase RlmH [Burkholderia contaminans]|nr:23S rRNA (pseudouridine(1915)-N(3))-methyltransferase RlmH [Burkholderia contaminans]